MRDYSDRENAWDKLIFVFFASLLLGLISLWVFGKLAFGHLGLLSINFIKVQGTIGFILAIILVSYSIIATCTAYQALFRVRGGKPSSFIVKAIPWGFFILITLNFWILNAPDIGLLKLTH